MNEPTPPPVSTRAARSRQKLLRAATDLLVDAGPRAVTVDAVAEASGVAKSTLYRHWASRDEMLVDVVRCNIPDVGGLDLTGGFAAALRGHLHQVASTLESPEWSRIVPSLMMLRTTMPEVAAVAEADQESKSAILRSILDLGVETGAIRGDYDVARVEALLYGPLLFVSITGNGAPLSKIADDVVDRFLARAHADAS